MLGIPFETIPLETILFYSIYHFSLLEIQNSRFNIKRIHFIDTNLTSIIFNEIIE